jgi:hypothetical protein
MTDAKLLMAGIALFAAFSTNAEAKLYKWVDDRGETHYSQTIPPEYAGHKHIQLDKEGRVIQKQDTPDKASPDGRKTPEERAAIEQRHKDKALLDTYTNASEIDLARNRNMQQVNARINSIKIQIPPAQDSLDQHSKEKDGFVKTGKKVPTYLKNDLADDEAKLARLQQELTRAQSDADTIKARFDADKARFLQLTGTDGK